jgi:tripeptide aminopeptidase
MPETALKTSVVERFLHYVTYDTQSHDHSESYPSTAKQLALLDRLVEELKAIGLEDAVRDPHGYVFATIPPTTKKPQVPVIGFVAHVDTSPESSGTDVKPIVHRDYKGQDLALPDDKTMVLRPVDCPALKECLGHDVITASGRTLLGADDKAGVAEIVAAAEHLMAHPEIPHGAIRIGFTPDEEIGAGTRFFDIKKFGAAFAYTLDGEARGRIDTQTFSADAMTVIFRGFNTHPGTAKGAMINSIKVAADFIRRLPQDRLSPETTEGLEGFVHPNAVDASVETTSVKFIIRDFDAAKLREKESLIETLAKDCVGAWPGASVTFKVEESYRNLKGVLDRHPQVVAYARDAYRAAGIEPRETAVRGGTDGSRLSAMGLPTPNLSAGGRNFHSRLEWTSAQDMEKATEVIVHLCRIWEERS